MVDLGDWGGGPGRGYSPQPLMPSVQATLGEGLLEARPPCSIHLSPSIRASPWYSGRGYPSNFASGRRMLLGEPLFGIKIHQRGRLGGRGTSGKNVGISTAPGYRRDGRPVGK